MSIHESVGYSLHCDFPGCDFETRDISDEFSSWTDIDYAIEEWREADGYHGDEGSYCRTHTLYEADEDGERDSVRPMPYTMDSLFLLAERRIAARINNLADIASFQVDRRCSDWQRREESAARRDIKQLRGTGWSHERIIARRAEGMWVS